MGLAEIRRKGGSCFSSVVCLRPSSWFLLLLAAIWHLTGLNWLEPLAGSETGTPGFVPRCHPICTLHGVTLKAGPLIPPFFIKILPTITGAGALQRRARSATSARGTWSKFLYLVEQGWQVQYTKHRGFRRCDGLSPSNGWNSSACSHLRLHPLSFLSCGLLFNGWGVTDR